MPIALARFSSREYASLSEQEPLVPAPGVEAVSLTLPRKLEPEATKDENNQGKKKVSNHLASNDE